MSGVRRPGASLKPSATCARTRARRPTRPARERARRRCCGDARSLVSAPTGRDTAPRDAARVEDDHRRSTASSGPKSLQGCRRSRHRDGGVAEEGGGARYSSFWEVAKAMQKRASRARARAREAARARGEPSSGVFDKDGRTGASRLVARRVRRVAALDGDGRRAESAAEESDLGHAARATLFFAQDMSRELLYDLRVATHSLSFWEVLRDRPRGRVRFLLFNTGARNFIIWRERAYRFWCRTRVAHG